MDDPIGSHRQPRQFGFPAVLEFNELHRKFPLNLRRPGEKHLHGVLYPGLHSKWAEYSQSACPAAELPFQDKKRDSAKMIPVQMGKQD